MRRLSIISLAAAAAVGSIGGTTAAVQLVDASAEAPAEAPAPAEGETGEPLLWASGVEIHDGETVVPIDIPQPDEVHRVSGGYLVIAYTDVGSNGMPSMRQGTGQLIRPDGTSIATLSLRGPGDVSDDGGEFIAMDVRARRYSIWSMDTGEVTSSVTAGLTEDSTRPYGGAALAGDEVLTTWYDGAYPQVVSWRPETDERYEVAYNVYEWNVSTDGRRFASDVIQEGPGANTCLQVGDTNTKAGRITSCDLIPSYVGPVFSPSAETMVALDPAKLGGDQPGIPEYVVVSTAPAPESEPESGPEILGRITPPEGASDAALVDDATLVVVADAPGGESGLALYRCDLQSECEVIEQPTVAESIVLGTP